MPNVVYTVIGFTLNIEFDGSQGPLHQGDVDCDRVAENLRALSAAVPLASFHVSQPAPLEFLYKWTTASGLVWKNRMTFDSLSDRDPLVTFNVDPMRASWYLGTLPLRQFIVDLIVRRKLKKIDAVWSLT